MGRIATHLLRAWHGRGLIACLVLPITGFYGLAVALRRNLFAWGICKVHRVDACVIVVGNVVAGGAGKTPTVAAIASHLTDSGLKVGIVSRGYGRVGNGVHAVNPDSEPRQVGDEPLLLRQKTSCPVFVGRDRHAAAQALLHRHPEVQVILCDDGLQHYALYRDVEVCVFDDRGCGNGWLLPSGPMRETWPRRLLKKSGQSPTRALTLHTGLQARFAGWQAHRTLTPWALDQVGSRIPLQALLGAREKPLFAVAGLAQPQGFFRMLESLNLPLAGTLGLPDHADFSQFDPQLAQRYTLLCTEKDAAKLWPIAPDALAIPLLQTMEAGFWLALEDCLRAALPPGAWPRTPR